MPPREVTVDPSVPRMSRLRAGLLVIPALIAACFIGIFTVDVPHYDEWDLMDTLLKEIAGVATAADYFAPHTANRIFFPRLILVALARVTGWSVKAEVWLSFALLVATWILVLSMVRSLPFGSDRRRTAAYGAVSVTLFSLVQWQNLLWGWQVSWYLANLGFVAAVAVLVLPGSLTQWRRILLAGAACTIASFCVVHGLAVWFGAFPAIVALGRNSRERILQAIVWIALAASAIAVYMHDIDPTAPVKEFPLTEIMLYLLGLLGAPIVAFYPFNVAVGAGVGLVLSVVFSELVRGRLARPAVPWLCFSVYALLFAVANAVGRVHLGVAYSATSRYTTVMVFLALSVVMLLLPEVRSAREDQRPTSAPAFRIGVAVLTASSLAMMAAVPLVASTARTARHKASLCRTLMSAVPIAQEQCSPVLHPHIRSFSDDFSKLRRAGYPGFPSLNDLRIDAAPEAEGGFLAARIMRDGSVRLVGWMRSDIEGEPRAVVVSHPDWSPVAVTLLDAEGRSSSDRELWAVDLEPGLVPFGTEVRAWTIAWNGEVRRLSGAFLLTDLGRDADSR